MDQPAPDPSTTDTLFPLVYEELKHLAHRQLRARGPNTLCTTDLVHEAFLKLGASRRGAWDDLGTAPTSTIRPTDPTYCRSAAPAAERRGGRG